MNKFFCPAPWTSIYFHKNTTISPCHTNRSGRSSTISEYIDSNWLKNIKTAFMNEKIPESCRMCFERESRNLKSTRQQFVKYNDTENFDYNQKFNRLELRSSNLCNFKCRMCDASSSSEIQKEDEKYPLFDNYRLSDSVKFDIEDNIEELKWFVDNYPELNHLCFTGGEPMLIKQYYQLMDYIVEKGLHENITLDLFTNCSVNNPLFIERMLQFKNVIFCMSIDGVGKTAEYQRHGTKWDVVEKNILSFVTMPKEIMFNTSISPYVLLDVSSLAKFLMRLYKINNDLGARCYAVITPQALHFENMNHDLRNIAYEEIDKAVEILAPDNFDIFKKELIGIKTRLQTTEPNNPRQFAQYTQLLDKVRNENFEEVFGYKLY